MANVTAVCNECGKAFVLCGSDVEAYGLEEKFAVLQYQKQFEMETGKRLFLSYYDCPECGKRHFVLIDDVETNELCSNIKEMFVAIARLRHEDRQINRRTKRRYNKEVEKLKEARKQLVLDYSGYMGKEIATGKEWKVVFEA